MLFPYVWYEPTEMSRMQASGFGTTGAAFLYFEALNRHAIVTRLFFRKKYSYNETRPENI